MPNARARLTRFCGVYREIQDRGNCGGRKPFVDGIYPLEIGGVRECHLNISDIEAVMAREDELLAQNRHDDDADTECRRLLCEENDGLRAKIAKLEARCKEAEGERDAILDGKGWDYTAVLGDGLIIYGTKDSVLQVKRNMQTCVDVHALLKAQEAMTDGYRQELQALTQTLTAKRGTALKNALETLITGLKWHIENHPEIMNECDNEALATAEAALNLDVPVIQWSKSPPIEQGTYWHWNGHPDASPVPLFVLYSGFNRKCFVSMGQLGITQAVNCDVYGGWWSRIVTPKPPKEGA